MMLIRDNFFIKDAAQNRFSVKMYSLGSKYGTHLFGRCPSFAPSSRVLTPKSRGELMWCDVSPWTNIPVTIYGYLWLFPLNRAVSNARDRACEIFLSPLLSQQRMRSQNRETRNDVGNESGIQWQWHHWWCPIKLLFLLREVGVVCFIIVYGIVRLHK